MNGYVWWMFLCVKMVNFDLKIKFKEILKYKFVIVCMFNKHVIYYFYVVWILVYNISNNDT
jgi:hypothetical protein